MVRTLALILCLAPALWAGRQAPDPEKGVRWTPTWNAAVEEARALNLPLIVHRHGFYWSPCWSLHRSVLSNRSYIRFSRGNCVEVMCMKDIEMALEKKPKRAETYRTKDAYGDEIECFVNFPGVTVDEMKELHEGEALNYMQGPLMPYTAVIDPHTMKDLIGLKRGEATSAKDFIKVISKHVAALKKEHGPGIDRKLWNFVRDGQVRVDVLLGEEKLVEALELFGEMERRAVRQPEVLARKVAATREVVMEDAKKRLDAIAKIVEAGRRKTVRRELDRLAKVLKGTELEGRVDALRTSK